MLKEKQVPKYFWTEALSTANFLKNISITKIKGKTPFEVLNNRKPKVKNLKIFGCLCYYKNNKPQRKLKARGTKAIFLGYDLSRQVYRIYDVQKEKIVIFQNV